MPTPDLDREDRFELPSALRKLIIPRHRLPSGSQGPELDEAGIEQEVAARRLALRAARPVIEAAMADPAADPVLVAATRDEDLSDIGSLTPFGAAAAAAFSAGFDTTLSAGGTVDIWVRLRGLPFAIAAFCVSATMEWPVLRDHQLRLARKPYFDSLRATALVRLLEHLRSASDGEYAASMAAAEEVRNLDAMGMARAIAVFLFPDRPDWREEDLPAFRQHVSAEDHAMVLSVIGADATADLIALFDEYDEENSALSWMRYGAQKLEQILRLVSWLPRDEAMRALIDRSGHKLVGPVLVAAAKRFPRRAVRLLAEAEPSKTVTGVLRLQVLGDPLLATAILPELGVQARGRVEAMLEARSSYPVAAADVLPAVLVSPPWLQRRTAPKPVVVEDLTARSENRVGWLPGERENWTAPPNGFVPAEGWPSVAQALAEHRMSNWPAEHFVCYAPEELVRPLLSIFHPKFFTAALLRGFVARYELASLPTIRDRMPAEQSRLLQPFTGPEIATFMADCLDRPAPARQNAQTWFGRHAEDAVRDLTPAAVGQAGVRRSAAEKALRLVAASGWTDVAAVATDEYGAEAGAAIAAMLADDGLHRLPRVIPAVPAWAEPATLPQIVLADRSAALPDEAIRTVVRMLAISKPGQPYAGIAHVTAACDRASLAAFAWALFQGWELAGASSKERWAYDGLALFGDDDTVQRLVPLIRSWPKENFVKRAIDGLDILAALANNTALSALNELAVKGKPPRLRKYAEGRVAAAAEHLGLSAEELADRIVPDLGVGSDGLMRLDYGPRQFVVGFDEQLKPYVTDAAGQRLKTLPKPGAKDHLISAQAAYRQFSALKKGARTLASEQIGRLERAMGGRRSWSAEDFEALLLRHPLLRHLVRRLVWTVFDAAPDSGGTAIGTFRVAEDLSLADVEDEAYTLPEGAAVAIAHPLDLGGSAPAWSDLFADYELLQPFQQLGRSMFELSDDERGATILTRFSGAPASPFRIAALERRGWRRGAVQDGGMWHDVIKPLPGDREAVARFSPGIAAGWLEGAGAQDIEQVWVQAAASSRYSPVGTSGIAFSALDPVVVSEMLRDLTEVMDG